MSERLEEIKDDLPTTIREYPDVEKLIEYVEELEKEKEFFRSNLVKAKANEVVLRSDNKRYKQALEEISECNSGAEGLDAERELERVEDIAIKALEVMK